MSCVLWHAQPTRQADWRTTPDGDNVLVLDQERMLKRGHAEVSAGGEQRAGGSRADRSFLAGPLTPVPSYLYPYAKKRLSGKIPHYGQIPRKSTF